MNNEIIDIHVHFGAPKDEESGCYWSDKFTKQPAYFAMLLLTKSLFKKVDINRVKEHLLTQINDSKLVDKFVLLALDEVYDENGTFVRKWTHLHVPNEYISNLAKSNDKILFGASVHPYRKDWENQIDYCLENGAVLCKWIPSSQLINPSHQKCIPFYNKLVDHHLPLLCHAGPEYAIPTSKDEYGEFNNPKYLRTALDAGVTVIIAHCSMPYWGLFDVDYQDDWEEFKKLFEEADYKNWNLYADLSAVCSPFREGYIREIKKLSNVIPPDRLIFGSDYPIPLSELTYNKSTNFFAWIKFLFKAGKIKNPLDKNYFIIKNMDLGDAVFTNASKLFSQIKK